MKILDRIYADVWLHTRRMVRLAASYVSYVVSTTVWSLIYILILYAIYGVDEAKKLVVAVYAWEAYSTCALLIAGWVRYFSSLAIGDVILAYGHNPFVLISLRVFVALPLASAILILLSLFTGVYPGPYTATAFLLALMLGHAYGTLLAALATRYGITPATLDILNFVLGLVGGALIPLRDMPSYVRLVALCIPVSYIAELARYDTGSSLLTPALAALNALAWIGGFYVSAAIAVKLVLNSVRRYGWKAPML